jgi:hypothetical protein
MDWLLIDGIGAFFRGYEKSRINWSKIPFAHLSTGSDRRPQWDRIVEDLRRFCGSVAALGYNTITLDDLAHLATHPAHEPDIAVRIGVFREEFTRLFDLIRTEFGLKILLTSDVLPLTPAVEAAVGFRPLDLEAYYRDLVRRTLDDFPQLSGLILRIGESDGVDVKTPIRTRLHLKTPADTNRLLRDLLPEFERRDKTLILRTWTVGAHPIGDLIWHRKTLAETLKGIDSPHFIVSMKHGESDFFRYLPLNRAFHEITQPKILELQARREYEGAGEYPSFIGWDCERFARELLDVKLAGLSVWCQTGGWHRFRRLTFLENDDRDIWIRFNVAAAIDVFQHGRTVEESVEQMADSKRAPATLELLGLADTSIHKLLYIEDFARQKLFFRRVRIPPLMHLYWDCLFVNHAVRKLHRHFVPHPERVLRSGELAASHFPRMIELAAQAGLPVDDLKHMRDLFGLIRLARRYYFLPFDEELADRLRQAKRDYKRRWPREIRSRYRIKLNFEPFRLKRRTLAWIASVLLRRRRGYRLLDHIFTLNLLGIAFRLLRPRNPKALPKFLRKSAMGVESLFR